MTRPTRPSCPSDPSGAPRPPRAACPRRLRLRAALAIAAAALAGGPAVAQSPAAWPTKPLRIVVPFPPGGTTDIAARAVGDELSKSLGQPVVIENKPGANTNIGAAAVARSAADGYTMLMASPSVTTNPSLYRQLDYDTSRDLAPLALVTEVALVMAVNPSLPASDLAGLVAHVKRSGKPLNCASSGNGSLAHLSCVLLKNQTGMDVQHVPYKGGAPMIADLIGGQVDVLFDTPAGTLPHIQSGKMKALATTGPRRIESLKDVATMREQGHPDFEIVWWAGMFLPAGTPGPIASRLHAEVARALESPAVVSRFTQLGIQPARESQADFSSRIRGDIAKWGQVVKSAGLTID